jgi:hypothetical protein
MTQNGKDWEQVVEDVAREREPQLEPDEAEVFARALKALNEADVPYLIGGAFAKHAYTGIWRDTKDLDLFLKPVDLRPALKALEQAGFETEIEFRHWLAKARQKPYFVDLIFGTGHGQLGVDDSWFKYTPPIEVAGVKARLIALEDLIASKAYVAERYRFDGADILHLIHGTKGQLDWQRVLARLGDNHGLLLWHLVLFAYVYPGRTHYLPQTLMVKLFETARRLWWQPPDAAAPRQTKAFRGTLLDPFSFIVDIEDWQYEDRRNLAPLVNEEGEVI